MKRMTYKNTKTPIRKNRAENGEKNKHTLTDYFTLQRSKQNTLIQLQLHNDDAQLCRGQMYRAERTAVFCPSALARAQICQKTKQKKRKKKHKKTVEENPPQFGPPYPTLKNMCVYSS